MASFSCLLNGADEFKEIQDGARPLYLTKVFFLLQVEYSANLFL